MTDSKSNIDSKFEVFEIKIINLENSLNNLKQKNIETKVNQTTKIFLTLFN